MFISNIITDCLIPPVSGCQYTYNIRYFRETEGQCTMITKSKTCFKECISVWFAYILYKRNMLPKQQNWSPWYSWNIAECVVKHKQNQIKIIFASVWNSFLLDVGIVSTVWYIFNVSSFYWSHLDKYSDYLEWHVHGCVEQLA